MYKFAQIYAAGITETPDTTAVAVREKDPTTGFVYECYGATVPTDEEAGFAKNGHFYDINATDGQSGVYINVGDETACNFVAVQTAGGEQEIEFNNDTGGTLTKGTLVFVSGWDTTANKFTVTKADQNTDAAQYVVTADVLTGADGVLKQRVLLAGLNTAGRTIDDDVFLADTGAFTFTEPTGATEQKQVVGQVVTVHASTGTIWFDLTVGPDEIGTNQIQGDAVNGDKIADDAVSLEHLDAGITPSHIVVFAGEFTTAGGDADETIPVVGLLDTDLVVVTMQTAGASPVTIVDAAAAADQINVDMSGDPSTDHVLTYVAYRAAA